MEVYKGRHNGIRFTTPDFPRATFLCDTPHHPPSDLDFLSALQNLDLSLHNIARYWLLELMVDRQRWRTWLGFACDYWKTALEYVPPELAMVVDILGTAYDWMFGRGTVDTKSCNASAPHAVWMSSKCPTSSFSLPDYRAHDDPSFGSTRSLAFSETEIFRSPPPSYEDFSNDVPITPSIVSSPASQISLGDFIVTSATRSPSDFCRARLAHVRSRDALIEPPIPQGLALLDPLDALGQLPPSPLSAIEPLYPALTSAPTPLAIPALDVGTLAMDSLDVSGHDYSSPSTSIDWERDSMHYLPFAHDRVDASTGTTTATANIPQPRRAGAGTPVRARANAEGAPSTRTRRRQRNKENLPPPQSPGESSPEPIARRTRATTVNTGRRNAIILSSLRSFRP